MKKILASFFLVFSIFILSFAQHESEHQLPKDSSVDKSTIVDSLVLQDSTKKELRGIISDFYSQGDSGSVNVAIINMPPTIPEIEKEVKHGNENKSLNLFTWWEFLLSVLFFLGLYFVLNFLSQILNKYNFLGKIQTEVKSIVKHSLLIYEAVALLILGSAFVLINPVYHGILAAVILATGFNHIKNYFSGRVVQFDQLVEEGKRL